MNSSTLEAQWRREAEQEQRVKQHIEKLFQVLGIDSQDNEALGDLSLAFARIVRTGQALEAQRENS